MVDLLQVGVITSTHGIKGEGKVFPTTDDPTRYSYLKDVILDTGKEKIDLKVSGVKYFKQYVIVKFKGINDINDIEKYKGSTLWVTRENAVPLEENEYFIADLIGLKVVTDEGKEFGELTDVMQTGANDVYVVETYKDKKEVLLPVIDECVLDVDLEKGYVRCFGKGSKERIIPIGDYALHYLELYILNYRDSMLKKEYNDYFVVRDGKLYYWHILKFN